MAQILFEPSMILLMQSHIYNHHYIVEFNYMPHIIGVFVF